jgi:CRP-like cAMP-binding protein
LVVVGGVWLGVVGVVWGLGVRTARVRAQTPVRSLAIARADFQQLLEDEPKLALSLLETLATRLAARG